jgi:heme exporter protein B
VDRSLIYFGKLISTLVFMLIVEAITTPIFVLLYGVSLFNGWVVVVMLLGTLGYAGVGTLLACMTAQTRARDLLLPILLFPVSVPLILASVKATAGLLAAADWGDITPWLNLLLVYDTIFLAVAFMTFEYLVEE